MPLRRRGLDVIALLEERSHLFGIEQVERTLEHRADLIPGLEDIDRVDFHQCLQPLGQRRLAAADRAKQIKDLLALLEALRRMAEERDDSLDRLFHPVEFREGRIGSDRPVHEDPAQPRILRRVDRHRFADRRQQAFGRARVACRIVLTRFEIIGNRHFRLATVRICLRIAGDNIVQVGHLPRSAVTSSPTLAAPDKSPGPFELPRDSLSEPLSHGLSSSCHPAARRRMLARALQGQRRRRQNSSRDPHPPVSVPARRFASILLSEDRDHSR